MKVYSAFSSGLILAAALVFTPAGGESMRAPGFAAAVPGDSALVFRKYRGADEVDDRDHSGRGSGGGGGGGGGGSSGGGGGDHGGGSKGGGNKDQSASGGGGGKGGGGGGKGNSNDGGDRFGN